MYLVCSILRCIVTGVEQVLSDIPFIRKVQRVVHLKKNYRHISVIAVCIMVFSVCSSAQVKWTWLHPYPTGGTIYAHANDGKTTVAVGTNGTIISSDNDTAWVLRRSGGTRILWSVIYANKSFFATGDSGLILTSQNLTDWTPVPFDSAGHDLRGICWTGSQFIAVSAQGCIFTSPEGTSWTVRVQPKKNHGFLTVAACGDMTIAAGQGGIVAHSTDGVNWVMAVTDSTVSNYSIFRKGNLFIIGGYRSSIFTSPDAITWTKQYYRNDNASPVSEIVYSDTQFVAAADAAILNSSDGISWTMTSNSANTGKIEDLRYNGQFFTAFCRNGRIFTSPDAKNWNLRTAAIIAASSSLKSLLKINDTIYAVGSLMLSSSTLMLSSTTLTNWQRIQFQEGVVYNILKDKSQFVAVGANGNRCYIGTSPDCITWNKRVDEGPVLFAITRTDSFYVAVGRDGKTMRSSDGDSWEQNPSGNDNALRAVTWTGTQLVAVGDKGTITTSTDGRIWTGRTSGTLAGLETVIWANNRLLVAGDSGVILSSSDGRIWKRHPVATTRRIYALTWTGKQYVAVGQIGALLASTDGEHWWVGTSPDYTTLNAIIWTGDRLIASGEMGAILSSTEEIVSVSNAGNTFCSAQKETRSGLPRNTNSGTIVPGESINIFSLSGKRLLSVVYSTKSSNPLASLPAGCYLMQRIKGPQPGGLWQHLVKH